MNLLRLITLAAILAAAGRAAAEPAPRIEGYDKVHREDALEDGRRSEEQPMKLEAREEPDNERREEEDARALVETVMMVRLSEELQLDDEQTVIMVRRLRHLKDEIIALRQTRSDLYMALKESLRDQAPDTEIQARLDALLDHDRTLETYKQDRAMTLGEGLTTRQQAQLYIFLSEFESDMRHLVRRAQERPGDWRRRDGDRRDRDSGGGGSDSSGADSPAAGTSAPTP